MELVELEARQMYRRLGGKVELDELRGSGSVGYAEALLRYRPELGFGFKAFARRRVRGAMLDHVRSQDTASRSARRRQRESGDDQGHVGFSFVPLDGLENELAGPCESPEDALDRLEMSDRLKDLVGQLSNRRQLVLVARYWWEWTFVEIGTAIGASAARACQIHNEALDVIRRRISHERFRCAPRAQWCAWTGAGRGRDGNIAGAKGIAARHFG